MGVDFRRDRRTVEEFEADLLNGHHREDVIGLAYKRQLEHLHGVLVTTEESGVGPEGTLIEGDLDHHKPDKTFRYTVNGKTYFEDIEIKTAPHANRFTFKVWCLRKCVEHEASILLYVRNEPDLFYVIPWTNIEKLLENPPRKPRIYPHFSPNNPSIQLRPKEYATYITGPYTWCEEAMDVLVDLEQT